MFLDPEHLSQSDTLALFRRLKLVHLAASGQRGPVLRTVHPIVFDGELYFHGSPKGEKMELLDQPAMLTCEDLLATIPSTWIHPERACPATSYFYSAHAHGALVGIEDVQVKAVVLQQMMQDYQPGGEYRTITATDPMYAAAVRGIAVVKLADAVLIGRRKVGQNRPAPTRMAVMRHLWERGKGTDLRAVDAMIDAVPEQLPAFLRGPGGERFVVAPSEGDVGGAVELLHGTYWNGGVPEDVLGQAQLGSAAWIVARDGDAVVATARAVSDGAKYAYVMDVCVREDRRGRGLGKQLIALLLDHPAVRTCRRVELHTKDAMPVYEHFGFGPMVDPGWRVGMRLVRLSGPSSLGNACPTSG